jgi:hypothetical protein
MGCNVLGIFSNPWPEEYGKVPLKQGTLWQLYHKAVWFKANPRSEEYMKMLFLAHWPDGDYMNVDQDSNWRERVLSADIVILLYPDAIGLGFRGLEFRLFSLKRTWTAVRIINGRKREFLLNPSILLRLYLRRFLERWMLVETLAIFLFLIATPILLMVDWVEGHR